MKTSLAEYWKSFEAAVIPITENIPPGLRPLVWAAFYAGARSCFTLCNLYADGKVSEDYAVKIMTGVQHELTAHHMEVGELINLQKGPIQ